MKRRNKNAIENVKMPHVKCSHCYGRSLEELDAVLCGDDIDAEFYCFECGNRSTIRMTVDAYRKLFGYPLQAIDGSEHHSALT